METAMHTQVLTVQEQVDQAFATGGYLRVYYLAGSSGPRWRQVRPCRWIDPGTLRVMDLESQEFRTFKVREMSQVVAMIPQPVDPRAGSPRAEDLFARLHELIGTSAKIKTKGGVVKVTWRGAKGVKVSAKGSDLAQALARAVSYVEGR